MNDKDEGYKKSSLCILVAFLTWMGVYLLNEYRGHKFAVFHMEKETQEEFQRTFSLRNRFLPYFQNWSAKRLEIAYITIRVHNIQQALKEDWQRVTEHFFFYIKLRTIQSKKGTKIAEY